MKRRRRRWMAGHRSAKLILPLDQPPCDSYLPFSSLLVVTILLRLLDTMEEGTVSWKMTRDITVGEKSKGRKSVSLRRFQNYVFSRMIVRKEAR